jgi:hypothetical protein
MPINRWRRCLTDQSGSALAMVMMAVLMVGVLAVAGMRMAGPKQDLSRTTQTQISKSQIDKAISLYVARNGALPCPEDGSNDAGTAGGKPSAICAATLNSTAIWGVLPWQALGLSPQDAVDKWGHRLTYAVSVDGTTKNNICQATGGLTTLHLTDLQTPFKTAAYVLVSHGVNGRGAFAPNSGLIGGQTPPPAATDFEAANCPRDVKSPASNCPGLAATSYRSGPYGSGSLASSTTWFDDIVTANDGSPYSCLCTLPSTPVFSVAGSPVTGVTALQTGNSVTVTATVTVDKPTCLMQWTSTLGGTASSAIPSGQGSYTLSSTYTVDDVASATTYATKAGSTGILTYTFFIKGYTNTTTAPLTSTLTITTANQATSGWTPPITATSTLNITYPVSQTKNDQSQSDLSKNNSNQMSPASTNIAPSTGATPVPTAGANSPTAPPGGAGTGWWETMIDYPSYDSLAAAQNYYAYFDFYRSAPSGGTYCYSSTPGGSGPYVYNDIFSYKDSSWNDHTAVVNTAPPGGSLSSVTVSAGGSGYTSAPTVTINGGGGTGATATANLTGGAVSTITVTNRGQDYTSLPTVTFSSGGGTGAAATATVGGPVTAYTVNSTGSGYAVPPVVSLTGGGSGLGASAAASLSGGIVRSPNPAAWGGGSVSGSGMAVVTGGTGYTTPPTVHVSSGAASATATLGGGVSAINLASAGVHYTAVPTVTLSGGSGSGATAKAFIPSTVDTITVTNGGSGYSSPPTVQIWGAGSGATATAVLSGGSVSQIIVTNGGTGYSSGTSVGIQGGTWTATATANVGGPVSAIEITQPGSGYITAPTVSITGGGTGSGAVATASVGGAIYFMGTTQGGAGCTGMSGAMKIALPANTYRRLNLALFFDTNYGAGTIAAPQAVGMTFKSNGAIKSTVYACYASSWNGTNGALSLFPAAYPSWDTGQTHPANWCNGGILGSDASYPLTDQQNPQYLYLFPYGISTFDEVDIFSVGTTKFWIGGLSLSLN